MPDGFAQRNIRSLAVVLASVYLGAILWFSRYHVLDDALIHLRFAELLINHGFFTTDGQQASFGTSSPLFVLITAGLYQILHSDLTTKVISVVFYFIFIGSAVGLACATRNAVRIGWALLAVVAMTPMGVRWLSDGMETSLVACLVLLLGWIAGRAAGRLRASPATTIALFVLGAVSVMTRVELAALVVLACGAIAITTDLRTKPASHARRDAVMPIGALGLGAMAALFWIWRMFGAVIPDTAIAKASGEAAPADSLVAILASFAGGLSFGAGLFVLWLTALAAAWRWGPGRRFRLALILPNLGLVLLWAVVAVRGQYLQGIRHLLPVIIFMTAANLAHASVALGTRTPVVPTAWTTRIRNGWRHWKGATLAGAVAVLAFELVMFHDIVRHRTEAFLDMRALNLARLKGTTGIGWDVGHLMYFTKAQVCDVSGLINGRRAAWRSESARLEDCLARDVEFIFATSDDAARLIRRSGGRFADWPVCGLYVFQNVRPASPHYLAVSPQLAPRICPDLLEDAPLRLLAVRGS
ncbi:MAG TPA: hypothetical protein VF342_14415 [Alphaproteobacteria bacterium]